MSISERLRLWDSICRSVVLNIAKTRARQDDVGRAIRDVAAGARRGERWWDGRGDAPAARGETSRAARQEVLEGRSRPLLPGRLDEDERRRRQTRGRDSAPPGGSLKLKYSGTLGPNSRFRGCGCLWIIVGRRPTFGQPHSPDSARHWTPSPPPLSRPPPSDLRPTDHEGRWR